jgi:hypothetical protein
MNRIFSQTITLQCPEPARLIELIAQWDLDQATTDIMGYMGTRVLADREHPGRYLVIADFGMVDPDVSAADEALRNNERPETEAMGKAVFELIDGQPEFHNFDEVYRTDQ